MIDAHCHLNDEQYIGEVGQIIQNYLNAGVAKVVCASSDLNSSKLAAQIATENNSVLHCWCPS